MRVVALPREDRRHAVAPDLLHRGEDPHLVVDEHVALRRIAPLDVLELLLLVDVDEHVAAGRRPRGPSAGSSAAGRRRRRPRGSPAGRARACARRPRAPAGRAARRTDSRSASPTSSSSCVSCGYASAEALQRAEVVGVAELLAQLPRTRPSSAAAARRRTARSGARAGRRRRRRCRAACCRRRRGRPSCQARWTPVGETRSGSTPRRRTATRARARTRRRWSCFRPHDHRRARAGDRRADGAGRQVARARRSSAGAVARAVRLVQLVVRAPPRRARRRCAAIAGAEQRRVRDGDAPPRDARSRSGSDARASAVSTRDFGTTAIGVNGSVSAMRAMRPSHVRQTPPASAAARLSAWPSSGRPSASRRSGSSSSPFTTVAAASPSAMIDALEPSPRSRGIRTVKSKREAARVREKREGANAEVLADPARRPR